MYKLSQPALAVAVVLAVACSPSIPANKRHLDRRRRTLPPQWRDPCISPLPLSVLSHPNKNIVISTEAAHGLIVSCAAEKPASLPVKFQEVVDIEARSADGRS
jgi:hypothetical protein